MCGIVGWLNYDRSLVEEKQELEAMTSTILHRGPDATNHWLDEDIGFGHTRLTVVDPAGGAQPMTVMAGDSNYTIVYNGELYNTEEIRQTLYAQGFRFQSYSDTEVVLHAFICWGERAPERLNGIFSFAVWDEKKKQLTLVRDRLGVKPLFYAESGNNFFFASELKAILANRLMDPVIGEEGLHELFALAPSRTPGHGVFKGIHELRPAHLMTITPEKKTISRYWQLESLPHTSPFAQTKNTLHELLVDTVERQLVSDVPLGTFLSGGVDSSILTAIAAKKLKKYENVTLPTFSVDYEENAAHFSSDAFTPAEDTAFIEAMSNRYKTNHTVHTIEQEKLADLLGEAVEARDLPGMADIDSSLLWFSRKMKEDVTVALSGECADEIFGGYPWFHRQELVDRPLFPWMSSLDTRESLLHQDLAGKLDLEAYVKARMQETLDETPLLDGESSEDRQRRQLFYLNIIWFMTTLLDRKDRMSMKASLEVRVPFADHRLVEYVWNVPWDMKQFGGQEKGLLRKAMASHLPTKVQKRKKSPYPKTHHPKYSELIGTMTEEILKNKNEPIHDLMDEKALEQLSRTRGFEVKEPFFGQLMTGPQLLAFIWQVNHWLKTYSVSVKL
ncbi:asparagine synthase (glutamine-hydrolyzing) [Salsuginibacillus kocurii]|uniref:asparagine synthase (glutamine-hydrolyzing) n=1 Tax=Salsuginibacillus kocurii TaxID=427078 RepID=UPI000366576E|nr:asparagine synthase (glutamine-hydrolyzing) [Salsuginibacillus kocurii]